MKIKTIYTSLVYLFVVMCFTIGVSQKISAQNITVKGVVVDATTQETLPGASIVVVGSVIGTVSDVNGNFQLPCPTGSTLEISYIGYTKKRVAAASNLKVELSGDAIALEEALIVGIGYGTMRKSDLTGAITSVSQNDLKKGIITSAEQLLQGKVAGLSVVQGSGDPAAGASVRLRGGTSLSASNSPLIVVDGIPGVDFNTVQPSEIVSIDVLKDASASAIYGSRGANGVIIVTTNRAASDVEKRSIEYNGYVAVGEVANHIDMLSADQWRAYVRENKLASAVDYGGNTNWQKELERTAISHSHNLFLSNVNANSGYRASITYQDSEGVMKRSGMDRLAGSVSTHQYALDKRLKVEVGVNGNFDNWHPIDLRILERAANLNPTVPVKDRFGEYTSIGGTNTENPVELLDNRTFDDSRHRFLGYGKIELEIWKGLKAVGNGSYEYNSYQRRFYVPTYAVMEGKAERGRGERSLGDYTTMQLETYLNYETQFIDVHKLNVMAGYSYLNNIYEGFGATRRGFDTDMFLYNNLAAGSDYRAGDLYSYKGGANLISFFGRANYNLMGKYMFTGTLRRDGSSRFGVNNKWGLFPSASLAWRVSDEAFMAPASYWLNNLKFRLGFGITGNQDGIGEYKSLAILGADGASYYDSTTSTWKKSYAPVQNINPDLKWESTSQYNIGLDFSLFHKITGTLELYYKKTTDLLWTYPVPQPPYLVGTMLANVGDLSNKGAELTLSADLITTKDFTWDTDVTFSYNKQNIDKLSNEVFQESGLKSGSLHGLRGMSGLFSQIVKEGYPAGAFYGPKCAGIDADGTYLIEKDSNGNPVNEYLGSAQPKFNLGFSMNFTYKGFDLNVATYGMFGQKVLNATAMSMYDPTRLPAQNVLDDFVNSGIQSDPIFSEYWVEDGSFFRLQSATLGYTLPKTKNIGIQKVRFYLTGENLLVLTGYSGTDPEVSIDGLDNPGIDRYNFYPRPRTISLGLNVTF
ncbi:TonB-dependent receptor SusC [termite gut metagenome]|uniref:TonB-dependent receptor SusC n=1 Tax=termite gut metagenome TaxID=433724 RepID=A0A5J4SCX5_9ZZZZ